MQLTYNIEHVAGYAGDLADSDLDKRILPMRNNSGADLPFGRMVASDKGGTGGTDLAARLPGPLMTDVLIGVSVRSAARAQGPIDSSGVNGVRDDDMFDVLTRGAIYVAPEQDVIVTDSVFARIGPGTAVDGRNDATGTFRKDADAHTLWLKKTAYNTLGTRRALSGYTYKLKVAGTSEDSDAGALLAATPAIGDLVVDGSCTWECIGRCDSSTRASAVAVSNAAWRASGTAASGLAVVELNRP